MPFQLIFTLLLTWATAQSPGVALANPVEYAEPSFLQTQDARAQSPARRLTLPFIYLHNSHHVPPYVYGGRFGADDAALATLAGGWLSAQEAASLNIELLTSLTPELNADLVANLQSVELPLPVRFLEGYHVIRQNQGISRFAILVRNLMTSQPEIIDLRVEINAHWLGMTHRPTRWRRWQARPWEVTHRTIVLGPEQVREIVIRSRPDSSEPFNGPASIQIRFHRENVSLQSIDLDFDQTSSKIRVKQYGFWPFRQRAASADPVVVLSDVEPMAPLKTVFPSAEPPQVSEKRCQRRLDRSTSIPYDSSLGGGF